jgi:hypothetical protein
VTQMSIYRPIRGRQSDREWAIKNRNQCGAAATGTGFRPHGAHQVPSVACQATGIRSK